MGCMLCYHNVSLEWVSLVVLIEKKDSISLTED